MIYRHLMHAKLLSDPSSSRCGLLHYLIDCKDVLCSSTSVRYRVDDAEICIPNFLAIFSMSTSNLDIVLLFVFLII